MKRAERIRHGRNFEGKEKNAPMYDRRPSDMTEAEKGDFMPEQTREPGAWRHRALRKEEFLYIQEEDLSKGRRHG